MTRQNKVTAVLFDWDLTLAYAVGVDTYSKRLQAIFRTGGISYSLADIEAAMRSHEVNTAFLQLPILPGVPQTQEDITRYYREILQRLGYINREDAFFDRLYDAFAELPIDLYADVQPTLEALRQQGGSLGIITNHSRLVRPLIEQYVGEFIAPEHIIISQELGINKPAPAIFRYAASQMQVSPAQCVFVGDNLYVDAVGAVEQGGYQMGMWIDRKETRLKRPLPPHVHRLTDLSQVISLI